MHTSYLFWQALRDCIQIEHFFPITVSFRDCIKNAHLLFILTSFYRLHSNWTPLSYFGQLLDIAFKLDTSFLFGDFFEIEPVVSILVTF